MEYEPLPSRPSREQPPDSPQGRRLLRWTWPVLLALIVGGVSGVAIAAAIHVPRVEAMGSFTPSLVTQLLDRNGHAFATFAHERRVMLKESEMPQIMENAVLASEDANFFRHGGIDAMGIARAAVTDLRRGRVVEGASTISMQLARSLFLSRDRIWKRKIEEAFLAVELEKNYSKPQILTLYLNLVNLGHGNYGVESASHYYFDKPASKLTLPEAAMLAGIIPAPSRYSPYRTPDMVLKQRDRVLRRMYEERFIKTEQEYQQALATPLLVAPQQAEESFAPYFAEDIRKYLETNYGAATLYGGGLQVQTTLDPQMQKAAEAAIRTGLVKLDHRRGWRGPISTIDTNLETKVLPTWTQGKPVVGRWYQGLVLDAGPREARVKIGKEIYSLGPEGIAWTNRKQPSELLKRGAVAWFRFEVPQAPAPKGARTPAAPPAAVPGAAPRLMLEQEPVMEGRRHRPRAADRGGARHGGRLELRPQQVQPRHPGPPAGGLLVQAVRLRRRPGGGLDSGRHAPRRPHGLHRRRRQAQLLARELLPQALRHRDPAPRPGAVDQRAGGEAARPDQRQAGGGLCPPLRHSDAAANVALDRPRLRRPGADGGGRRLCHDRQPGNPHRALHDRKGDDAGRPGARPALPRHLQRHHAARRLRPQPHDGRRDRSRHGLCHPRSADRHRRQDRHDGRLLDAWFVGFTPRYTILTWVGYDVKRSLGAGMSGAVAALPMWRTIAEHGLEDGWLQKGETFQAPPGVAFKDIEYYSGLLGGQGTRTLKEAFVAGTEPNRQYSPQWSTIASLPWYQQKAFYIPKEREAMPTKDGQKGGPPPSSPAPQDGPSQEPPPP